LQVCGKNFDASFRTTREEYHRYYSLSRLTLGHFMQLISVALINGTRSLKKMLFDCMADAKRRPVLN